MPRFGVLGPVVTMAADGRPLAVRGPAQRRLLAVLLAFPNQTVSRDRLIEAVWPDDRPRNPSAALHTLISRLRQAFGHRTEHAGGADAEDIVHTEPSGYRLTVGPDELDALAFERQVSLARGLAGSDPTAALDLFISSSALWRGRAFDGLGDVLVLQPEAVRLEELRLAALEDRAEVLVGLGRCDDAVTLLDQHVQANPSRERPLGQLMRALYAGGRQTDALRLAATYRRRLADELGLDASPELRRLEEQILRHEVVVPARSWQLAVAVGSAEPAAGAPGQEGPVGPAGSPGSGEPGVGGAAGRLPVLRSSFVGRRGDVDAVIGLLRDRPAVTLIGVGGVGKTRLALEVGRVAAGGFPDGVLLCELAEAVDEDGVLHALAAVMSLGPMPGVPLAEQIVDGLAEHRALLVLDNCEQVIDAVSRLTERVLASSDTLRVLATSRERLGIDGESLWRVEPLGLPAYPSDDGSDSVRLFQDRARAVDRFFELTADNREIVAELCQRLDGLPLAIELAAAQLHTRTLREVADDLAGRHELRSAGRRTAARRHQSLQAVVSWSTQLLEPRLRQLFEQLSVFPSDFDLASASAVVDVGWSPAEVAHGVVRLVECSLVQRREVHSSSRYYLLNTLREFGLRTLRDSGQLLPRLQARHAAWYVDLAERFDRERAALGGWIAGFDRELSNLRAARRTMLGAGDVDGLLRLSTAAHYYAFHSLRPELFEWADGAVVLAARTGGAAPASHGAVLGTAALGAWLRGDVQQATELAEQGVLLCRSVSSPHQARGLDVLGDIAANEGRVADAIGRYREEVEVATVAGDEYQVAMHSGCLAIALAGTGEAGPAGELLRRVDRLVERSAAGDLHAMTAMVKGEVASRLGEPEHARQLFWKAVDLADHSGSMFVSSIAWIAAATMEAESGDPASSARAYRSALTRWSDGDADVPLGLALRAVVGFLASVGLDRDAARLSAALPPAPASWVFTGVSQQLDEVMTQVRARLGAGFDAARRKGLDLPRPVLLRSVIDVLDRLIGQPAGVWAGGPSAGTEPGASTSP